MPLRRIHRRLSIEELEPRIAPVWSWSGVGAIPYQFSYDSVDDLQPCVYNQQIAFNQNGQICYWDGVSSTPAPVFASVVSRKYANIFLGNRLPRNAAKGVPYGSGQLRLM